MIATPPTTTPTFQTSNLSPEIAFDFAVEVVLTDVVTDVAAPTKVDEAPATAALVTAAALVVTAAILVLEVAVDRALLFVLVGVGSELPPGPE